MLRSSVKLNGESWELQAGRSDCEAKWSAYLQKREIVRVVITGRGLSLYRQNDCQCRSYPFHDHLIEFADSFHEPLTGYRTELEAIRGGVFIQAVAIGRFYLNHPRRNGKVVLPVGNRNDHPQRESSEVVVVDDDAGPCFLYFGADSRVERDEPDVTLVHRNFPCRGR